MPSNGARQGAPAPKIRSAGPFATQASKFRPQFIRVLSSPDADDLTLGAALCSAKFAQSEPLNFKQNSQG